jgi:hypothetical protein
MRPRLGIFNAFSALLCTLFKLYVVGTLHDQTFSGQEMSSLTIQLIRYHPRLTDAPNKLRKS